MNPLELEVTIRMNPTGWRFNGMSTDEIVLFIHERVVDVCAVDWQSVSVLVVEDKNET